MASTLRDTKSNLMRRALDDLARNVVDSELTLRQKLALTCRVLFDAGHDSGLAGQITARAEAPGTYYTQQLGLGFDEITDANLLLVDEDLNVLHGAGMANPANRFHSWIYRARPDVNCIVHTHPFHSAASRCRCKRQGQFRSAVSIRASGSAAGRFAGWGLYGPVVVRAPAMFGL